MLKQISDLAVNKICQSLEIPSTPIPFSRLNPGNGSGGRVHCVRQLLLSRELCLPPLGEVDLGLWGLI